MSDEVVSSCVSLACIACWDVVAGILADFASIRHACVEKSCLFDCSRIEEVAESREREPLISQTAEPRPHLQMQPESSRKSGP